jgi:hypothetical protein
MFASIVEAASTKLKYVNYAANYESDGGKLAEKWWFALVHESCFSVLVFSKIRLS